MISIQQFRNGVYFRREKTMDLFSLSGPPAGSNLSDCFTFSETNEGSDYWHGLMSWLCSGLSRKIVSYGVLTPQGLTAEQALMRMIMVYDNQVKFNRTNILIPPSRRGIRFPDVPDNGKIWPIQVEQPVKQGGRRKAPLPQPGSISMYILDDFPAPAATEED